MPKAVYFNLQTSINHEVATKFIASIEDNLRNGMTEMHVLMASAGGLIDPGMAVYNFLRGIPVKVSTYNYGSVDSIAGVIYCAGSRRLATPHCRFLIHGVNWQYAPNTNVTVVTEHQLREALGQVAAMKRNIASVLSEATGKKLEQVEADMTASLTLTADQGKSYGLVHELTTVLVPPGFQVIGIR